MSKKKVVDTDDVLKFIKNFINTHQMSPTTREIQRGVGIKSVASAAYHIAKLVEKGLIEKTDGTMRNIVVKNKED